MTVNTPRDRTEGSGGATAPPEPPDTEVSAARVRDRVVQGVAVLGEIVRFSGQTIRNLGDVRHYVSEVFRQCGILILSSALVVWFMQFMMGTMCGTESYYITKQVGAPSYAGVLGVYCGLREMGPYMWAYIFAAKVGCGLVAEIGSMRIAEEVDAMEVMGVKSRSYLVGSRIIAYWIAMPFMFIVGLLCVYASVYLVTVVQLGGVSSGGYLNIFWLYQNPLDLVYATLKVMAMGTAIVFVSCYYGYTATGGPVGVGHNTAKSMMVNMALVHIISTIGTFIFWGLDPNAPIAN